MSDRNKSDRPGVLCLLGILAIVGFVLFYLIKSEPGPDLFTALQQASEKQATENDQIENQNQLQAQQETRLRGQHACYRAAHPPPEARAPRDVNDTLSDMAASLDRLTNNLKVDGIQHAIDEAILSGNTDLTVKLRKDLLDARREKKITDAESDRRAAARDAHEQALNDIAECRKAH
jgi:hypothetical protein